MAAASFKDLFIYLEKLGVADVLIPFLLIFTVVFAVLEKAKILGEGKKNFNVIVALSIALIVVIPHVMGTYPAGKDAVVIINNAIPNVSVAIIAIILFLVVAGTFGINLPLGSGIGVLGIGAFLIVLYIFGSSAGWWSGLPNWISSETETLIVMAIVFIAVIAFITGGSGGPGAGIGKMLSYADNLFRGRMP